MKNNGREEHEKSERGKKNKLQLFYSCYYVILPYTYHIITNDTDESGRM